MKKVVVCCLVIFLFLFSLGCGKNDTVSEGQGKDAGRTVQTQPEPANPGGTKETQPAPSEPKGNVSVSVDTDKGVDLPKGYPQDKFPIYKDSYIFMVNELEGGYLLTAFSKDSVKDVMEFYTGVLATAQVIMETKAADSLTSFGTKDGYSYSLDVGPSNELKDYQTSITIVLQPE